MRTAEFHFDLPPDLIAQQPAARRDESRLLVLHRLENRREHRRFPEVTEFLRAGDVLVLNNSRVLRARLRGVNIKTGGAFEMLLLEENATNDWWALMKPGKRARLGTQITLAHPAARIPSSEIVALVTATNAEGHRRLRFSGVENILNELETLGEVPLPPYIRRDAATFAAPQSAHRSPDQPEPNARVPRADPAIGAPAEEDYARYQTVYAQWPGSVAAPTAGLHFTPELLDKIRARGVEIHFVTLHVGLGTFAPVKAETLAGHHMHEERYEMSAATARAVNAARREGRRVIAVGTTSVRVLESAVRAGGAPASDEARWEVQPGPGRTRIFLHPPCEFKIVDALLTNFHLPCSTLLMLVSAFAAPGTTRGRELVLATYAEAIRERYRFFSYGDAMLIL